MKPWDPTGNSEETEESPGWTDPIFCHSASILAERNCIFNFYILDMA